MYLGDCASKKPASANVETVFSGAKKFSDDATTAHDDLLGGYVQNHINYTYEWLRPLVHDIVCAYMSIHGPDPDMGDESEDEGGGDALTAKRSCHDGARHNLTYQARVR